MRRDDGDGRFKSVPLLLPLSRILLSQRFVPSRCSIRVTAHYFFAVADFRRLEVLLQIVPSAAEFGFRCRIRCSRYAFPSPLPHAVQKRGFSWLKLAAFVDRLVLYLHQSFFSSFSFLATTVDDCFLPSWLTRISPTAMG